MGIRLGADGSSNKKSFKAALETLRNQLTGEEQEIGLTANDLAGARDQEKNFITKLTAPLGRALGEWLLSRPSEPGNSIIDQIKKIDPIAEQVSSGHTFMAIATAGIMASLLPIIAAFSIAGSAVGTDGAAMWAMPWVGAQMGTLWLIGAVRAYIIPVLPFIYMSVFGFVWLTAVLEAAIALVLWAFGWLRLDGEDMLAQASKTGAMLLFGVFILPTLGMLAFLANFTALPLIVGTVEALWATAFWGNQDSPGLTSLLVGLVLITFLSMYLIIHCFGQIFALAHRGLVWLGHQGIGFSENGMLMGTAGAAAAVLGRGMPGLPSIPKVGAYGKNEEDSGGKVKARVPEGRDISDRRS